MTLALYGGSFNPPHAGHVALARSALETLRPDILIWMPSGDPPHKKLPESTPSAAHRLEMSRMAVSELGDTVKVSDFELAGGARYTADTVRKLSEQYCPARFWLLMGSDMRDSFDTWHKADEMRGIVEIVAFPRTTVPVSSTEVRAMLAQGLAGDKLPPAVLAYIRREGLYGYPKS